MGNLLNAVLLGAAAWAVYTDLKSRRISNRLTFGAAAIGLLVRLGLGGLPAFEAGMLGWLAGVGLLLVPFVMGWMGAGDVKLLAAFGALGGASFVLQTAVLAWLCGGLMAIFCLVREGKLWFTVRYMLIFLCHPFGTVLEAKRRMPFGPALAFGATASLVLARIVL